MKIEVELWVENFGQEMRGDRTSMDLYYPITQRDQTQKSNGPSPWTLSMVGPNSIPESRTHVLEGLPLTYYRPI